MRLPRLRTRSIAWTLGMILVCGIGMTADACDTPVYRYAMYRWVPAPYEVYYFHHQAEADAGFAQVEARLKDAARSAEKPANVLLMKVDLEADPDLHSVPPDVKEAFLNRDPQQAPLPCYLVSTPQGVALYSGKLDEPDVQSLLDSPLRLSIARQLEAGKMSIFGGLNL